ncbi:S8 family serine peptidase [Roseinatronobacter alkalisoli]|uniref:S8 family serine peptidase n=1 Tax=Roseinatronobacter alkalisoli TaxID=3028235 RepID=A0ABT5TEB3_9RHOB|nr:S8 family serine peptidase [Roseinatronobacter sp. HJB301]MDD7973452.1 S8 family serine peptidase [Roseinatronobacter sp. HJB301]
MPCTLIALKRGADIEAFEADMVAAGVKLVKLPGLRGVYRVDACKCSDLDHIRHPSIQSVDDGDAPTHGHEAQPIEFDQLNVGGAHQLARVIRRGNPWLNNPNGHRSFPVKTFFECERDGTGVDIYVVDSGIRATHEEFDGRATNVAVATGMGELYDEHGHGTRVASVAAGVTTGLARGSEVRGFKALDSSNSGTLAALVEMLGAAVSDYNSRSHLGRPAVMNVSLGATGSSGSLNVAMDAVMDAGIVLVSSAGNAGNPVVDFTGLRHYPACFPDVVCVGGSNALDLPYWNGPTAQSNRGNRVDISGPAQQVWAGSFVGDDTYQTTSGTSFASPLTAAVLACMLQGRPRISSRAEYRELVEQLRHSATRGAIRFGENRNQPQGAIIPDRLLYVAPKEEMEPEDWTQDRIHLVGEASYVDEGEADEITLPIPAGAQEGDLLLLHLIQRDFISAVPAGWTHIQSGRHVGNTVDQKLETFKRKVGSEAVPETVTVQLQQSNTQLKGIVQLFRGPVPIDVCRVAGNAFNVESFPHLFLGVEPLRVVGEPDHLCYVMARGYSALASGTESFCVSDMPASVFAGPTFAEGLRLVSAYRDIEPGEYSEGWLASLSGADTLSGLERMGWVQLFLAEETFEPTIEHLSLYEPYAASNVTISGDGKSFSAISTATRWSPVIKLLGTTPFPTGAVGYYWEISLTAGSAQFDGYFGVATWANSESASARASNPIASGSIGWRGVGEIRSGGALQRDDVPTFGNGDRLMMAFNPHTGEFWIGKNGTWFDDPEEDPATYTTTPGFYYRIYVQARSAGDAGTLHTTASDFAYAVPAGCVPAAEDFTP